MLDIKFSIRFPGSHSRKNEVHISNPGDPTYFVESLHNTLIDMYIADPEMCETILYYKAANAYRNRDLETSMSAPPDRRKGHTIRAGGRWKPGDQFVPKIWPGRPYHCSPVAVGPPITIVKTYEFERRIDGNFYVNGHDARLLLPAIAANDGLSLVNFLAWFKRPFKGQIIVWDPRIQYYIKDIDLISNFPQLAKEEPYIFDGKSISAAQAIVNGGFWIEEGGEIDPAILKNWADKIDKIDITIDSPGGFFGDNTADAIEWKNVKVMLFGREIGKVLPIQYVADKVEDPKPTITTIEDPERPGTVKEYINKSGGSAAKRKKKNNK